MTRVILTADRSAFTDYAGTSVLGYVACMPSRLVPRYFMDKFFTPPIKADKNGKALYAPYSLRKLEALLSNEGFDTMVTPPEYLKKVANEGDIVGITAHDPLGIEPVSMKLSMLFGGGKTWTAEFFEELGEQVRKVKKEKGIKVLVGGPGVWQLERERPEWIDTVYIGDGETDLPEVLKKIEAGEKIPVVKARKVRDVTKIPTIKNPARLGEVQVTRGCPRGCQFCSITPETFMSIPLDDVVNYPALTDRASPPRGEDFLLLPGNLLYTPLEKGMYSRGLLSTGSKGSPDPA
ncbi:hypothetical protein HS7_15860 [Sulfolobales archaeon HS-7]|nr:hypothetical protein HS7_15860 [Sulfolobales archaeon HS-7]